MSQAADALQARAEVLKLARLLQREPETFVYLERLGLDDLRALHERVLEALFDDHSGSLHRLAAASRLLPAGVSASIGQNVFGEALSARLTGVLDPERAVEMAAKLPPGFLADVAIEMDPRRASEMVTRLPPKLIAETTAELARRGEHVTMGRFVGHLGDEAIGQALAVMDDAALLQTVFVLEDKGRLSHLVDLLPPRRVAGVIRAAADDDLWVQALDLLDHLAPAQRSKMVAATLELEPAALRSMIAAVIANDLWEEVLPIAEREPTVQAALAQHQPELSARVRKAVAKRARAQGV
jgi:hypothetical protein